MKKWAVVILAFAVGHVNADPGKDVGVVNTINTEAGQQVVDLAFMKKFGSAACYAFKDGDGKTDKSSASAEDLAMFQKALPACDRQGQERGSLDDGES
ncbi:hypothetical protein [Pseudomonas syringae]|uniref:hypothetical protein n=1 Tax=Pseudomonas syringae TaxID=317 RepID=UPI00137247A4|nr:hypothetical protein [Pseudomonas syringae]NAP32510.1 hypothetical protein [Pseudomonas syringae]